MEIKMKKICDYMHNNRLEMEEIINDYEKYIYSIIRNVNVNMTREDEEEIVFDVFIALWKNKEKLEIDKSMSSYIAGITKNVIKLKFRKINYKLEEIDDEMIDKSSFDLKIINNDKTFIIRQELEKLKDIDKDVFVEYYYKNLKIEEISKMFSMSTSKIKSKLYRVRKKLKKALKERGYNTYE